MTTLKTILQSIGALLAGYIVSALLTAITISVLGALFPASYNPENIAWVIFNVLYGCVFAVIGGYITAWIAPSRHFAHAIGLGVLMAVFALLTAYLVAITPPTPEYANQPGWYYPVLAITVVPSVALGGWLRTRTRNKMEISERRASTA